MSQDPSSRPTPYFPYDPHIIVDPAPEIWRIIHGLEVEKQLEIGRIVVDAHIAHLNLRAEALGKAREVLSR
jgi:hypothetical protein